MDQPRVKTRSGITLPVWSKSVRRQVLIGEWMSRPGGLTDRSPENHPPETNNRYVTPNSNTRIAVKESNFRGDKEDPGIIAFPLTSGTCMSGRGDSIFLSMPTGMDMPSFSMAFITTL